MKKIVISLKSNDILDQFDRLVVYIFLMSTAYVRIIDNNSLVLAIGSAALLLSGTFNTIRMIARKEYSILLMMCLFAFWWLMEALGRPSWIYEFRFLVSTLCYLGIAYSILTNQRRTKPYYALYSVICVYIILKIIVFGVSYRTIMKEGSSYNYISIFVLFYLLLLNYIELQNGKELEYIPAGLFVVVSFISYGRGGIATAALYTALLLISKGITHKRKKRTFVIGTIIICSAIIGGRIVVNKLINRGLLNKFFDYGMDSNGRIDIWTRFLNTCNTSIGDFLLGGDPRVLDYMNNNMHNSFLQLYATFGFVLFFIVVFFLMMRIMQSVLNKEIWLLVIICTFISRAMLDKLMYRGYHEIIFYTFLFEGLLRYGLEFRKIKKKSEN